MREEVFIPQLGQTVEEVTIVDWQVNDCDRVTSGQVLLTVETDKANFDVEASSSGYIHIGPYQLGDVVPVLTVVAIIGDKDDVYEVVAPDKQSDIGIQPKIQNNQNLVTPNNEPQQLKIDGQQLCLASPLARKIALEHGIDISSAVPTGKWGNKLVVVVDDIYQLINQDKEVSAVKQTKSGIVYELPAIYPQTIVKCIPLTGVRGVIAKRMAASAHTTARVTLVMDVDATELIKMRNTLKDAFSDDWGFTPSYNDILACITAYALKQYPYMNARINGELIELLGDVNIGVAVDTERGLVVPVVKQAHTKSIKAFGVMLRELVKRAKQGKSFPDDLEGGTFTITNLGIYDVDIFTPVINLPEAAILGIGKIEPRFVVNQDRKSEIRDMMKLSLVFDHRLVDGAPAARFLKFIKDTIENPYAFLSIS